LLANGTADKLRVLAASRAEEVAAGVVHLAGPAQRGRRLTLAGMVAGITHTDGKLTKKGQSAPLGA
jgi:ABC-type cobalamin transport system ATPase subunit